MLSKSFESWIVSQTTAENDMNSAMLFSLALRRTFRINIEHRALLRKQASLVQMV
ncbi:hypothetical protein Mapa_006725 [Marchantia paleacea]|nr:hypothetical protein Mapa_006725 [Marchantia paleacea]